MRHSSIDDRANRTGQNQSESVRIQPGIAPARRDAVRQRHEPMSDDERPNEIARDDQLERAPVKDRRRYGHGSEIAQIADRTADHARRNGTEPKTLHGAHERTRIPRIGQPAPHELVDLATESGVPAAIQPREEIPDARTRERQGDPEPMQETERRNDRAKPTMQLEGLPMPVEHAEARPGRHAHHAEQRQIDHYGHGERAVQ